MEQINRELLSALKTSAKFFNKYAPFISDKWGIHATRDKTNKAIARAEKNFVKNMSKKRLRTMRKKRILESAVVLETYGFISEKQSIAIVARLTTLYPKGA